MYMRTTPGAVNKFQVRLRAHAPPSGRARPKCPVNLGHSLMKCLPALGFWVVPTGHHDSTLLQNILQNQKNGNEKTIVNHTL